MPQRRPDLLDDQALARIGGGLPAVQRLPGEAAAPGVLKSPPAGRAPGFQYNIEEEAT